MFENLESKFIEADGLKTHYVEQGEGPPLVLIHGGGAGADGRSNFFQNFPTFSSNYRTIAYDMPGFGLTAKPDPEDYVYSQENRHKHLIAFIEALGFGPAHLIGNSMGGSAACGAAINRPDLVRSQVLMGAAVNVTAKDMSEQRERMGKVLHFDGTREGIGRLMEALTHSYKPTQELMAYRHEMATREDTQMAFQAIMAWAGANGLAYDEAEFADIDVPTLVVAGQDDIIVTIDKAYDLLAKIPHAEGHFYPDCGHWVMVEKPDQFCELTMNFFARTDRGLNG
ncbi:alpha/beta fold hydrolase [Novosphingopyxis sp.]|uniref:alpha/beta fold hydrolase n=1 Tax=Novosphingopyxis sp. TaxID=2709690 RepID=UPI003B58D578